MRTCVKLLEGSFLMFDIYIISQHIIQLIEMNTLAVLYSVLGWHPLPHTQTHTHTLQPDVIQASSCICICCCVASGIYQGFMFPEVWSYFHEHVGKQVTTGVLRLLSVITSQFVTCSNIIGQKRHQRNNVHYKLPWLFVWICVLADRLFLPYEF